MKMGEDITNTTELKGLFYQTFISITIYVFLNKEVRIIALASTSIISNLFSPLHAGTLQNVKF